MKIDQILEAVAVGLDAMDGASNDPAISAATKGAATVVRLLAGLVKDRSPEESIKVLERIRDHGTGPISQDELDAQVRAALEHVHSTD